MHVCDSLKTCFRAPWDSCLEQTSRAFKLKRSDRVFVTLLQMRTVTLRTCFDTLQEDMITKIYSKIPHLLHVLFSRSLDDVLKFQL